MGAARRDQVRSRAFWPVRPSWNAAVATRGGEIRAAVRLLGMFFGWRNGAEVLLFLLTWASAAFAFPQPGGSSVLLIGLLVTAAVGMQRSRLLIADESWINAAAGRARQSMGNRTPGSRRVVRLCLPTR